MPTAAGPIGRKTEQWSCSTITPRPPRRSHGRMTYLYPIASISSSTISGQILKKYNSIQTLPISVCRRHSSPSSRTRMKRFAIFFGIVPSTSMTASLHLARFPKNRKDMIHSHGLLPCLARRILNTGCEAQWQESQGTGPSCSQRNMDGSSVTMTRTRTPMTEIMPLWRCSVLSVLIAKDKWAALAMGRGRRVSTSGSTPSGQKTPGGSAACRIVPLHPAY